MTKRNSKGMEMIGCLYSIEVMLTEFGPFRLSYSQDAEFLWRGLYTATLAKRDRAILALAAEGKVELSLSNEDVVVSWST